MATFSDYFNQQRALSSQTPQRESSAPRYDLSWLPAPGRSMEDPDPQTPLNWIVDIISRPLFAVTDTIYGISETNARAREGQGFGALSGFLEHNPLTGLLSTNKGNKRTFGDLMEDISDRHGPLDDPNYVDTDDNVDPAIKGGVGFALDVVLDPLTWIPGTVLAKGGKAVLSGGKKVVEKAGDIASRAIAPTTPGKAVLDSAARAVDDAARAVDDAVPASRASSAVADDVNEFADVANTPSVARVPEAPKVAEPEIRVGDHMEWARSQRPDSAIGKVVAKMEKTSDPVKLSKFDDEIMSAYSKQVVKDVPEGTPVRVAEPEGFDRFANEFRTAPNAEALRQTLESVQKIVGTTQNVTRTTKVVDTGQAIPGSTMKAWAEKSGTVKFTSLPEYETISDGLSRALSGDAIPGAPNSYVRLLNIASAKSPVAQPVKDEARGLLRAEYFASQRAQEITEQVKIADTAAAFLYRKGSESSRFNKILGEDLTAILSNKSSQRLDELIPKILEVLDPGATDEVIQRFFEGRNMKQLSEAVRASLGVRSAYVKPVANTVEETTAVRTRVPQMQTAADEAVAKTLHSEVTNVTQTYPHKSGNVRFSSLDEEARLGRHSRQLNTFFQYSLMKNLRDGILKRMEDIKGMPVAKQFGARRAQAYRQAFLEAGDSVKDSMLALGLKMHIGAGHKETLLPLDVFDAYRIVETGFKSSDEALTGLWNFGSAIAPTRLMEGVHAALTATSKNVDEILSDVTKVLSNQKLSGVRGQILDKNIPNNALKVKYGPLKGQNIVGTIAEAIVRSLPDLEARLADNVLNYAARGIDEATSLSKGELRRLTDIIGTDDTAAAVKAISGLRQSIADAGTEIGAFPSSVRISQEIVEEAVGPTATKVTSTLSTADEAVTKGVPVKEAVAKSSTDISEAVGREADDLAALREQPMEPPVEPKKTAVPDEDGIESMDFGSMYAGMADVAAQQGAVKTFLEGPGHFLKTKFKQDYGMEDVFGIFHAKRTVAGQYLSNVVDHLRVLKKFTPEQRVAAFKVLQSGVPNSSPELNAAIDAMTRVTNMIFDTKSTGKGGFLNSRFLSTEPEIDHINDILKMKGLPEDFRFTGSVDEMLDQWRTWDMKDPMTDLYKLADAAATVSEHRAIVGNFVYRMKKEGLVSETFKPGMVRITNSGGSTFARLMPEGLFVDKAMASQLHRLDVLTRTSREFSGELGELMRKTFIPVQNIWKQLVTVFRVGHHIRNAMGNFFMAWVDRGNRHLLQSHRDAFRVLGVRNNYSDIDLVDSLARIGDSRVPVGNEVLFKGRQGEWTLEEIAQAAQDRGLFSSYSLSEDLMEGSGLGAISRVGSNISNSAIGRVAGGVSHFVDHHGKVQHLIQILRQEGGSGARWNLKTKEALLDRAIREVKRAHPDALMLTPTEAKLRFAVPFYTWFAKTLPFAMESALRNPGRIAVLPKASYNLAVATGVNPESIVDPFPEDQLFPSFLTEGAFGPQFVGPDGQYININPGAPQFDLADTLMDPLGSISPLIKVPAELMTGSRIGGQKITDMSDYLDQNLPVVNYLANMTGISPTGSLATLPQGKGLDPQAQVARGNKDEFDQALTFSNWFTGLNAQNWSRPNYINYAEIEKRNRARENSGG